MGGVFARCEPRGLCETDRLDALKASAASRSSSDGVVSWEPVASTGSTTWTVGSSGPLAGLWSCGPGVEVSGFGGVEVSVAVFLQQEKRALKLQQAMAACGRMIVSKMLGILWIDEKISLELRKRSLP